MISRSFVPSGSSYTPGRFTWPLTPKSVLPVLAAVPIVLNHAAPRVMIAGTCDTVSTLLTVVGQPQRPETAGNGGRLRGWPLRPPADSIIPLSSPQIYAPAPPLR